MKPGNDLSSSSIHMQPFSSEEYDERLSRVRAGMVKRGLDGMLISSPDNICYLTGLSYHGYFAYQLLVVPQSGQPCLITRAMEGPTIRDEVPNVRHCPYSDSAGAGGDVSEQYVEPVNTTVQTISEEGLSNARIGFEANSSYFPYGIAQCIQDSLPNSEFVDASDVVSECRLVKSPQEIEYARRAAKITDAMLMSGIATAGLGVLQRDVMAAIYQAMLHHGGTYPAFVPLLRTTDNLDHEHSTWEDKPLKYADMVFIELSGCVARYHAPAGRLFFVGDAPKQTKEAQAICDTAFDAIVDALKPGVLARDVYAAWQKVVDDSGLTGYRRQHCGYSVGIGFPPSWSGSGVPKGLRYDSEMQIRVGMVFHLMSALFRTRKGDYFISNCAVVTENGCEVLTQTPHAVTVR